MLSLAWIVNIALALLVDKSQQPGSAQGLYDQVLSVWARAGGQPLAEEQADEVLRLVHAAWDRMQDAPLQREFEHLSWGELVEDPFVRQRAAHDLAEAVSARDLELEGGFPARHGGHPGDPRVSFSDVSRDETGWWTDPGEVLALLSARPGDGVGDSSDGAWPPRIYWTVLSTGEHRIDLAPTDLNPFTSGVGAGGKIIDSFDLQVASGENERKRLDGIRRKIADGSATIDDVTYALLGTVPMQMGPNGAQGGWYNPDDTRACRGARHALTTPQIVHEDAHALTRLGFSVPQGALTLPPILDGHMWDQWVSGAANRDPPPVSSPDPIAYARFLRKLTRQGKYRYDEDGISKWMHEASRVALERYWEHRLRDFLAHSASSASASSAPGAEREPWEPQTLVDLLARAEVALQGQARQLDLFHALDIPGEDGTDEASIRAHLRHPEPRVSRRNAALAVHRAQIGVVNPAYGHWRDVLIDWIRWGGADDRAYENAIDHASLTDDVEMLTAAIDLPSPDNRERTVNAMVRLGQDQAVARALLAEDNPKVVAAAISAARWQEEDQDRSSAGRSKGRARARALVDVESWIEHLEDLPSVAELPGGVWTDYKYKTLAEGLLESLAPDWMKGFESPEDERLHGRVQAVRDHRGWTS